MATTWENSVQYSRAERNCFVLGAGVSLSAEKDLITLMDERLQTLLPEQAYNEWWASNAKVSRTYRFSAYYEKVFAESGDGRRYINAENNRRKLFEAYNILANIICNTPNNVVIVTPYNNSIERFVFEKIGIFPTVYSNPKHIPVFPWTMYQPSIVKLDLETLESGGANTREWGQVLDRIFSCFTPLLFGCSNADAALCDYLLRCKSKPRWHTGEWAFEPRPEGEFVQKCEIINHNGLLNTLTNYCMQLGLELAHKTSKRYVRKTEKHLNRMGIDIMKNHPIFGQQDTSLSSKVFVIMPFTQELTPIYEDHIRSACNKARLSCRRADDIFRSNGIMNDIWSMILNADIIVCDCTNKNANVFYELGIAHTLGKEVICMTQNFDDIPFDVKHRRAILYTTTNRGGKKLEEDLVKYLSELIAKNEINCDIPDDVFDDGM